MGCLGCCVFVEIACKHRELSHGCDVDVVLSVCCGMCERTVARRKFVKWRARSGVGAELKNVIQSACWKMVLM